MRVSGHVFKGWGGGGEGRIPALKNFEDIRRHKKTNASLVGSFGNKMVLEICRECFVKMRDL